jgi:hypothetical protein
VFITKYGHSWNDDSTVTHEMRKLLNQLGLNGHRSAIRSGTLSAQYWAQPKQAHPFKFHLYGIDPANPFSLVMFLPTGSWRG